MRDRSELIAWIRGDIVGPTTFHNSPGTATFQGREFRDPGTDRKGALVWKPAPEADPEEVLYFERETPHRKYGVGLLHPDGASTSPTPPEIEAAAASDPLGADEAEEDAADPADPNDEKGMQDTGGGNGDVDDDFEVTSPDVRRPSTLGISFCVRLEDTGRLLIHLPTRRRLSWQAEDDQPTPLNGRYERCKRQWTDAKGVPRDADIWRRWPALLPETCLSVDAGLFAHGKKISLAVTMPAQSPIALLVEVFPRRMAGAERTWLVTVVLRNVTRGPAGELALHEPREAILYQTFFEVSVERGCLAPYPESLRPFEDLDLDEKSLALLYRESATWGIGHSCAAGWEAGPGEVPRTVFADVLPTVQLPSMTADIQDRHGNPIELSMRQLAGLSDSGEGLAWDALERIAAEYGSWLDDRKAELPTLPGRLPEVGDEHLKACGNCLTRIRAGIALLRSNQAVRDSFRLANLSMLLQQISTKQLPRRLLECSGSQVQVRPAGAHRSPWNVYSANTESGIGRWRAFQIAFLLMSLDGVARGDSPDREIVDLIWFPTGGGKTEAYLGVIAFYLFHERFLMSDRDPLRRDGTNALMRYTLRMLTTQQFQRAASLICAMEFLRRNSQVAGVRSIPGSRFSLGLWIGGDGSPNKIMAARSEINRYRRGDLNGNPLILTDCPWCRAEIGRYEGKKPTGTPPISSTDWNSMRVRGIGDPGGSEGPMLHCADGSCEYGKQDPGTWLPVEVIDERIYRLRPSLVIGTADKLAMIAYRPDAGALFGRTHSSSNVTRTHAPPGLIVQDELHLISGPLGTMYAFYEGIVERLCSTGEGDTWVKPKLIASTATIRGAGDQVRSLYDRGNTQLFPSPGLLMGDSFFGRYSRDAAGRLSDGRLYLGIHANDYGSILTTQVRTFSAALFRPFLLAEAARDPWWTLLAFYNSIRELGGAKTLFESDIRSRLKFIFNREGFGSRDRRNLRIVEELTIRLYNVEIVDMMDQLGEEYSATTSRCVDACLASNIIEVGVDIERLSLMGVVGQPKTTAQYIQVTGRVGRKWWERPGLIMMIYNPSKSRDRSHYEQFHSYHRRLYERVEPTSATPFAVSAIQRALPGAVIAWARQNTKADVQVRSAWEPAMREALKLLRDRCSSVQVPVDVPRSEAELDRMFDQLFEKWGRNPQEWEEFPPSQDGQYLMLWPGQYSTRLQRDNGMVVPSSMRQVDASAELSITPGYTLGKSPSVGTGS